MRAVILWLLGAVLVLTGCAPRPSFDTVDDAAYAGAICTDGGWTRVPDQYCPIGDEPVGGQQYWWRYRPYRDTDRDIDVVYVGYQVDRTVWIDRRPARVSTLHIDRGSFPTDPPASAGPVSRAKVLTAAEKRRQDDAARGVSRGGLGSTQAATRSSTPETAQAQVSRRPPPPPPAGQRAMAKAKTKSTPTKK
jgi:hypothetical protein